MKNKNEATVERGRLIPTEVADSVSAQLLTSDDVYRSGFLSLGSGQTFEFNGERQIDLYIFSGAIIFNEQIYPEGSYLSLKDAFKIKSDEDSVRVFYYSEPSHKSDGNIFIPQSDRVWCKGVTQGMNVCVLRNVGHTVSLVSWDSDVRVQAHSHDRGEEILVLKGKLRDPNGTASSGEWIRFYPGAMHAPYTQEKTLILLRNGHLPR